jgi:hypothetical protein
MRELVGHTLLGRYRVASFLGRGGMAAVYRAWDNKRATFVALKLLNEDLAEDYVFLRRFTREAEALERLDHPNIVRYLGFERAPGTAFLVMEYVDGVTLRRHLHILERPLTLPEALGVLRPVCGALHYAHQIGVYHCDIKPANIFIERSGRIVVGDFGIAQLSESATVTFSTPGTPAYMAPEQCRGREDIDGRTDLYSLGITTFEMLTLDRPFRGESVSKTGSLGERVRSEQVHAAPPSPRSINPQIPEAVEAVILQALEKEPARRQQRVLEFYEAFQRAASAQAATIELVEKPETLEPVPPPPGPGTGTASPALKIGLAVTVGGLILAVVLVLALAGLSRLAIDPTAGLAAATREPVPDQPAQAAEADPTVEMAVESTAEPAVVPTAILPSLVPSDVYILYVLDASNSMMESVGSYSKLAIAQTGLAQHLYALDPTINTGLLVFGHRVRALEESPCGPANVEVLADPQAGSADRISSLLPGISAIGKSPLEEAINTSYGEFTFRSDRTNALIVIADGGDNCSGDPLRSISRRQEVGQRLPIYVIGLGVEGDDRELLAKIADETEGTYRSASDAGSIVSILEEYVQEIRR